MISPSTDGLEGCFIEFTHFDRLGPIQFAGRQKDRSFKKYSSFRFARRIILNNLSKILPVFINSSYGVGINSHCSGQPLSDLH
jgi:hypothetical protein